MGSVHSHHPTPYVCCCRCRPSPPHSSHAANQVHPLHLTQYSTHTGLFSLSPLMPSCPALPCSALHLALPSHSPFVSGLSPFACSQALIQLTGSRPTPLARATPAVFCSLLPISTPRRRLKAFKRGFFSKKRGLLSYRCRSESW